MEKMSEQEIRAWSLLILSLLNNDGCHNLNIFMNDERRNIMSDIQEYIKTGKINNRQPDGLHEKKK